MLIYHPAFDAYHCVFRFLAITDSLRPVELSKLRLLDYLLCFPAELSATQLPQEHIEFKKLARAAKNPYRGPVSSNRVFRDMEPIQLSAARMLAASNILDAEQLTLGIALRTTNKLPGDLSTKVRSFRTSSQPLVSFIIDKLSEVPLSGVGGLKQRTGLMEYRYDVA